MDDFVVGTARMALALHAWLSSATGREDDVACLERPANVPFGVRQKDRNPGRNPARHGPRRHRRRRGSAKSPSWAACDVQPPWPSWRRSSSRLQSTPRAWTSRPRGPPESSNSPRAATACEKCRRRRARTVRHWFSKGSRPAARKCSLDLVLSRPVASSTHHRREGHHASSTRRSSRCSPKSSA